MGIARPRGGRLPGLLGLVAGALAVPLSAPSAPLAGQGTLRGAVLEVGLAPEAGPISVALELEIRPDSGAVDLPLTLLTPGDTRLSDLRASWNGGDLSLRILRLRPHYWTGTVRLPGSQQASTTGDPGAQGPGSGSGPRPPVTVRITYRLEGGWEDEGRITVPVPAPAWVPEDPHPETFRARVRVPKGLTVTESFPTSVVARPDGPGGGRYEVALQGMPSMLILRVVRGEAPALSLELLLDGLVVLTLVLMGLAGLQYLRKGSS